MHQRKAGIDVSYTENDQAAPEPWLEMVERICKILVRDVCLAGVFVSKL